MKFTQWLKEWYSNPALPVEDAPPPAPLVPPLPEKEISESPQPSARQHGCGHIAASYATDPRTGVTTCLACHQAGMR